MAQNAIFSPKPQFQLCCQNDNKDFGEEFWGDYAPIEERVEACPHCFRACQCVGFKEEYSADVPGVPFLREKYVCPTCGEFFGVTDLEAMKRAGIELRSWYFK